MATFRVQTKITCNAIFEIEADSKEELEQQLKDKDVWFDPLEAEDIDVSNIEIEAIHDDSDEELEIEYPKPYYE